MINKAFFVSSDPNWIFFEPAFERFEEDCGV
jgi:hypothetical protein